MHFAIVDVKSSENKSILNSAGSHPSHSSRGAHRLHQKVLMLKKKKFWSTLDLAVYWTNGVKSLLEISRLVKQEVGKIDLEFLIDYFRIISKYGLIEVEEKPRE